MCHRQFMRTTGMAWHFMMVHYFWGYILRGKRNPNDPITEQDNKKPPP